MRNALLVLIGAAVLATGCAHTVQSKLHPAYETGLPATNALSAVRPALTMGAGAYSDARADTTKLTTFQAGIHTYNFYGDRPVSEVLFEGLRTLFAHAGHTWSTGDGAAARIDVKLLNLQGSMNAGMIAVGASSSVQVKFDFTDARKGTLLYSQVYNGTDKRSQAMIGSIGMVNASLNQSILNCINEVGKDEKLAEALRSLNTP